MRQWRVHHVDFFFFFTGSVLFRKTDCACLHGSAPCLPTPSHHLNVSHMVDGIFQSWLWWRGSIWHTGDFLLEHLLSSCWIPPRDTIKPLPTQLVFTGGCFASSKKLLSFSLCKSKQSECTQKHLRYETDTSIRAPLVRWSTLWTGLLTPGFRVEQIT